jgi:hypothetical protein
MQRRKALAVAATVTGTLAAAGAAMAVNFGLLGAQPSAAGKLDARNVSTLTSDDSTTTTEPDIQVIYQDIPVPGGGGSSGGSSGGSGGGTPGAIAAPTPAAPAGGSTYSEDHESDDHDEYEHEDESEHEDDHEVHEGEEDDD